MSFVELNEMFVVGKRMHQNQKQNKKTKNPLYYKKGTMVGVWLSGRANIHDQHAGFYFQHDKYEQSKQKTWMYGEVRFMLYKMNLWT